MSDHRLTSDIPLGEFEGASVQAHAAVARNARLHATDDCPQLRTTDVRSLSVQLNAATVARMCARCAGWGRWAPRDSALGTFLDALLGNGLLWELDIYQSADPDDPDEADIARAAEVLSTHGRVNSVSDSGEEGGYDDDGDHDHWEKHQEALSVRDGLVAHWRSAADSLYDASSVVRRYPWLEEWAQPRLDAKAAYVERVRRALSALVDPRNLLEAAAVSAIDRPELLVDQPELSTLGAPSVIRDRLEGAWRDWSRRVADDWSGLPGYDYLAHQVVNGESPRRRKGRQEAIRAITRLYAQWTTMARERADIPVSAEERFVIAEIPEVDLRLEYGGRDHAGFDSRLSRWEVGVLAVYTVASNWPHRTMLLRLPALMADRLVDQHSSLKCYDATADVSPDDEPAAHLSRWIAEHGAASAIGPLPGVFDDTPVSNRRLLSSADVKVLRKTNPRGDLPCLVFSVEAGVEALLLSTLEKRCATGWRGVLLAGPSDLPTALIHPWADDVRTTARTTTSDGETNAWRREPSSACDPDFGAHLGFRAGVLDMERDFHSTPGNPEDLEQLLRMLAVAQAADDLRSLGGGDDADRRALPPALWRALLTIHQPDLTPFEPEDHGSWRWSGLGLPLSVLADVQVYTTIGSSWYGPGKGHAPHCQHADHYWGGIDSGYELLTLARVLDQKDYDWCSKCGGYAIRRLTEVQVRYYRAAHRLCEINGDLEPRTTRTASAGKSQHRSAALTSELEQLAHLQPDPLAGPYDTGNSTWHRTVRSVMKKAEKQTVS